ncbi:hypothetical protein LO762_01960 [Actinocorallia sp. API 0066]|uniref:hypothetical protein n=1 Tax=Actinocorallia sp. API 0066 TaxID=2896846 RepID=UPI001E32DE92|nr:hypothetical protein [Actinocorallia sp. API 0066]MCD0447965.1 hypothetical protein [Actinocorallia sp. API 0066]
MLSALALILLPVQPSEPVCDTGSVITCLETLSDGGVGGRPRSAPVRNVAACPEAADYCGTALVDTPLITTADLVGMAKAALRLPLPRPRTAPAPRTLVNMPTDLVVQDGLWRTRRASAAVAGRRVELVGRPTRIVWDLGPEGRKACLPRARCVHTWTRASGDPLRVVATVEYRVAWRCTGGCDEASGELSVPASGTTSVVVHEAQTRTGR